MTEELMIPASIIGLLAVGALIAFLSNYLGNFVSCKVADAERVRPARRKSPEKKG